MTDLEAPPVIPAPTQEDNPTEPVLSGETPSDQPQNETHSRFSKFKSVMGELGSATALRTNNALESVNRATAQWLHDLRALGGQKSLTKKHQIQIDFKLDKIAEIIGEHTCRLVLPDRHISGVLFVVSTHILFGGVAFDKNCRIAIPLKDVAQISMDGPDLLLNTKTGTDYRLTGFGFLGTTYNQLYNRWIQVLNEELLLARQEDVPELPAAEAEQE